MNWSRIALRIATIPFLGACAAPWSSIQPGFSCTSGDKFAAPPVVVQRGEEYFLTWTQGEFPFFFAPSYSPIDDRLVFAMAATSSSGFCSGQHFEMRIEGVENVEALRRGGAAWWEREPGESWTSSAPHRFVELRILEETRSEDAGLLSIRSPSTSARSQ